MKKHISLILLISCVAIMGDNLHAARAKFKKIKVGKSIDQAIEAQSSVVVKNESTSDDQDDLDIDIEQEEAGGGVSEPLLVVNQEPHSATKSDEEFNGQAKKNAVEKLVNRGITYLKSSSHFLPTDSLFHI